MKIIYLKTLSAMLLVLLSFSVATILYAESPQATNLSASETYTEDTPLNLTDVVITDADSGVVTVTFVLSTQSAGSLSTATAGGVTSTYNAGTGVWTAGGAIADVNTILSGLTFTPTSNFNSNFTIATNVTDGVDAPVTGTKAMTGTSVNDAPVLDTSKSPTLTSVTESAAPPTGAVGTLVSTLVDFQFPAGGLDNVSDVDNGAQLGVAITGAQLGLTCYYSLNGGATWNSFGLIADARLLAADSDNRIYCNGGVGSAGTYGSALSFRAWDQTSGVEGSTADVSTNGGTTAFSSNLDTISLTINAPAGNSAPIANDDEFGAAQDSNLVSLDVLANDTDVDVEDELTIASVGTPSQGGTAVINETFDAINYQPAADFCGDETFDYTIADNDEATSNTAMVTVEVLCTNITILSITPTDNATNVNPNADFVITFDEPVIIGSGNIYLGTYIGGSEIGTLYSITADGGAVTGSSTDTITIDWPSSSGLSLGLGEEYFILINPNAFTDGLDRPFDGVLDVDEWNFTTLEVNEPNDRIALTPTTFTIDEGSTQDIVITLSEPIIGLGDQELELTITSPDPDRLTISPSVITVEAADWNVPQEFTLTAVDDEDLYTLNQSSFALIVSASSDSEYYDEFITAIEVTITDNDAPEVLTLGATTITEDSVTLDGQVLSGLEYMTGGIGFVFGTDPATDVDTYDFAVGPIGTVGTIEEDGVFAIDYNEYYEYVSENFPELQVYTLECGTTYYFAAIGVYGQSLGEVAFSDTLSFTTLECTNPQRGSLSRRITPESTAKARKIFAEYYTQPEVEVMPQVVQETNTDSCPVTKPLTQNLKQGARDGEYHSYAGAVVTDVSLLQEYINDILKNAYASPAGPIDGRFGPLTKQGVERMQQALLELHGKDLGSYGIDGIVGEFTRDAINGWCQNTVIENE